MNGKESIWIVTSEQSTRSGGLRELKIDDLSINVNLFLEQMENVLAKTPDKLGKFQFVEFEIRAEVTGKGMLAILGTGGEVGATGGLKFVFRRMPTAEN